MKTRIRLYLMCIVLLAFCGCGQKPYPKSLLVADSLASVCPDSAIALLDGLEGTMQGDLEATRMYYRLLRIKANDKAYILHTSDSLILPVLHYYIRKNDRRHLPEAYYYAGRVYRDLGDAPQALDYFQKAIESMPKDEHSKTKKLIYSQMGTLFAYQRMYEEALEMYRLDLRCAVVMQDTVGMVYGLRDIANMYWELGKRDSTLIGFKDASRLSIQLRRTDMFNGIQSQLAALYTELQMYDSARIALQYALRDIERPNKSGIYSIASKFYHQTGQMDSAIYYYEALLNSGTIYAKRTAHRGLAQLSISRHQSEKALMHTVQERLCSDSINKITNREQIRQMHSLYNYQLREKENLRLKAENQQKNLWLALFVFVLIIIVASFVAYLQYSKRKSLELKQRNDKLQRILQEKQEKIKLFERSKAEKDELEKNLVNIDRKGNEVQKKQLKQRIELLYHILQQQTIEHEQELEAEELLFGSELFRSLQARANSPRGDAYVTQEEWSLLKEHVTTAYPAFLERLYSLLTPNENELHVCLLIKLRFRQADIARLLQFKPESISSIRRRLYQKVTSCKGSPDEWNKILLSL